MFKSNLSPLNPTKDKYSNGNFITPNSNDFQLNQNHNFSNYQYSKNAHPGNHTGNTKYEIGSNVNYPAPLSPLSPSIIKNPMSPTAKIKMFSNTLNLNKKLPQTHNTIMKSAYQNGNHNTHEDPLKQNKIFGKFGVKNHMFDPTQSIDLKCDQILEDTQLKEKYRKQTPQSVLSKENYHSKKTKINIPILNLQAEFDQDDLKCDQILDMGTTNHPDDSKRYIKLPPNVLFTKQLENNSTYVNQMNRNGNFKHENAQKQLNSGPLTPNYQRKKGVPSMIMVKRQTERSQTQTNNSLNTSKNINLCLGQQKSRSFTNILTPQSQYVLNKVRHQQNNQQEHPEDSQAQDNVKGLNFEQLRVYFQRTTNLLQTYKKKLGQVEEKNVFLQKQNVQLRKNFIQDSNGHKKGEINFNQGENISIGKNSSQTALNFNSINNPTMAGKYTYHHQMK